MVSPTTSRRSSPAIDHLDFLARAVLKSGGSAFEGFHRDEFTTLPEVADRIFSTSVTLDYEVKLPANTPLSIGNLEEIGKEVDFIGVSI